MCHKRPKYHPRLSIVYCWCCLVGGEAADYSLLLLPSREILPTWLWAVEIHSLLLPQMTAQFVFGGYRMGYQSLCWGAILLLLQLSLSAHDRAVSTSFCQHQMMVHAAYGMPWTHHGSLGSTCLALRSHPQMWKDLVSLHLLHPPSSTKLFAALSTPMAAFLSLGAQIK
jgi:hypothetical protein